VIVLQTTDETQSFNEREVLQKYTLHVLMGISKKIGCEMSVIYGFLTAVLFCMFIFIF